MKLVLDNIDIGKWENLLNDASLSTPFQTPIFYNFIKSIKGYEAFVFAMEDEEELKALCIVTIQKESGIKGFFSKRAIIYGGPIFKPEYSDALTPLLKSILTKIRKKAIYIECRNSHDYSNFKPLFELAGWTYLPHLNFHLSLTNKTLENILTLIPYNRRREIKKSINEGVTWNICNSFEELKEVYSILEVLYKTRVKLPLPKLDYFQKLYQLEISKVFIVKHNNTIIGGSICLLLPQRAIYTMYYCGKRNYNTKIFPTHIAVLAAIQFGIQNGIKILDFMGAGKPREKYGVRDYKAKFGGELVENGRFVKIFNPVLYNIGRIGIQLLKKL